MKYYPSISAPCEDVQCAPHAYCKANGLEAFCVCEDGWTYDPDDIAAGCIGKNRKPLFWSEPGR